MENQTTVQANTQTGEIIDSHTEVFNLRKEAKQFTSTGRKVAKFTCVLKYPNGTKTTYRSDTEHKKLVQQKILHAQAPEYMAVIKRFEEFATRASEAYIFQNLDDAGNVIGKRIVKAVYGKITYNISKYFEGKFTVLPETHQNYRT